MWFPYSQLGVSVQGSGLGNGHCLGFMFVRTSAFVGVHKGTYGLHNVCSTGRDIRRRVLQLITTESIQKFEQFNMSDWRTFSSRFLISYTSLNFYRASDAD